MTDLHNQNQRLHQLIGSYLNLAQSDGAGVQVITSCTSLKAITTKHPLNRDDFLKGQRWVEQRQNTLPTRTAEHMYLGQQHLELMSGVSRARGRQIPVTVRVVSAGYGLVNGDREIAPYDTAFSGLSGAEIKALAAASGLPEAVREALQERFDLTLVLLGRDYLRACQLPQIIEANHPIVFLASDSLKNQIPRGQQIEIARLTTQDTRTFKSGFVGLKGSVARAYLDNLQIACIDDAGSDYCDQLKK